MIINKIIKLGLEGRVNELKDLHSEREIASILSTESNQKITQSCVHRYIVSQARQHKDLIEKKENLRAKVVEAEIDTITRRNKAIDKIEGMIEKIEALIKKAETEGVDRTLIDGLKTFLEAEKTLLSAFDSLDKRLGRFTEKREVDMNVKGAAVVFYIPDNNRDKQKEIEGA